MIIRNIKLLINKLKSGNRWGLKELSYALETDLSPRMTIAEVMQLTEKVERLDWQQRNQEENRALIEQEYRKSAYGWMNAPTLRFHNGPYIKTLKKATEDNIKLTEKSISEQLPFVLTEQQNKFS